jgi:hypothetical protein
VREPKAEACVVINKERVVLGLLRDKLWDPNVDLSVEDVLEPGPTTLRPHLGIESAAEYLRKATVKTALVTTPDGRLVGMLRQNK